MVVGIDEVGRGCLAGPVCVAAVILDSELPGLADSKQLTAKQRQILALAIKQHALGVGLGWMSSRVIDEVGIIAALRLAGQRALLPFVGAHQVLLDGSHNYLEDSRVTTIIRGDASVPSISAASIIAKVARDAFMGFADKRYPGYGFGQHVGYGTAQHMRQLAALGPSPIHRLSFAPLKGSK